jgi:hypothetical protein
MATNKSPSKGLMNESAIKMEIPVSISKRSIKSTRKLRLEGLNIGLTADGIRIEA